MTEEEARQHFWDVVLRCLKEFHGKKQAWAKQAVDAARQRVKKLQGRGEKLYYHAEPFDVACRLAKSDLDIGPYLKRYLELRDRVS
jgi:hypothetical protein